MIEGFFCNGPKYGYVFLVDEMNRDFDDEHRFIWLLFNILCARLLNRREIFLINNAFIVSLNMQKYTECIKYAKLY